MGLAVLPPENIFTQKCYILILFLLLGKVTKNQLIVCIHLAIV
jgi:hypothetical protein